MEKENHRKLKGGKTDVELYVQIGMIAILTLIIAFTGTKIYSQKGISTGFGTVSAESVIPTGTPSVYGSELGISYNDVSQSNSQLTETAIDKLTTYEDMNLNTEQMQRYINIAGSISCEYCCGANALIFADGSRACECSHSYAMRGLAKYLITNHPEMSDTEILSELGKWKTLFFPSILQAKATVLEANGIDSTDYVTLTSNQYRGIEYDYLKSGEVTGNEASGSSGSSPMVGDC